MGAGRGTDSTLDGGPQGGALFLVPPAHSIRIGVCAHMLRVLRENPRVTAAIFAVALLLPSLLAERLAIPFYYVMPERGGRWFLAMRILYLLPVITGALSLLLTPETFSRVLRMRYAVVGLVCVAADVAVFAAAGVLERSFRAALSFTLPAAASVGALLTGIALFRFAPAAVDYLIAAATTTSAVVGGFQMAEAVGWHTALGLLIVRWDQATAETFHSTIAWMRAEGFAQNPNTYTPFAIVGFIWILFGGRKGPLLWVTLASSVAICVLGQSRTTLVVIAVLLGLALVRRLSAPTSDGGGLRVVLLAVAGVLLTVGVIARRSTAGSSQGVVRALTEPLADTSIATRIDAWQIAARAVAQNPWGTFARAGQRMRPYSHAHNEFLNRLLYAGPLWLLAHITFLIWLSAWLRPQGMRWIGIAIAASLFLNGLAEPLGRMYPYNVLLYVIIGSAMWAMAQERTYDQTPVVR